MRTQRALDALNVFVSDVRDGVGPYLAVFLAANAGFSPSQIGWILGAAGLASLLMVSPAGFIFDSVKSKRALLVTASALIALFTVAITLKPGFWAVIGLQVGVGLSSAFIGPGILAVSAITVSRKFLPVRIARNETFNHAGNFLAAALAGLLARTFSVNAVFILVVVMSVFTIASILSLGIDRTKSKSFLPADLGAQPASTRKSSETSEPALEAIKKLFRDPTFIGFLAICAVYQVANASLLPLAAQACERNFPEGGVRLLSIGIVAAQLTAIPVAWASGQLSERFSPKFCLALGFVSIVIRAAIFATVTDIHVLMAAQIFDGVAAGVLAVAPILWLFKLIGQSRYLAFSAGLMASSMGVGAAISNIVGGYMFQALGPSQTFTAFGAIALLVAVKLAWPESMPAARPLSLGVKA